MDKLNEFIDMVIKAIDTRQAKKTKPQVTQAEVLKVDGDTAWVHIPGGAPETPVKKTIACKVGDIVQVRVSTPSVIIGNNTAPPTDDTTANEAKGEAERAASIASKAQKETRNTRQYFWFLNGDSSEAGAHVTELPMDDFLRNPRNGNLLLRSNAVRIRLGQQILSELTDNRVTLASGKAVVKYSEDGSAFGLQDSHRIVVCKGTDEPNVRNDATLSSMDVANFDINSTPMAFFNATHKNDNGTKTASAGLYTFDGAGHVHFAVLNEQGVFEVHNEIKVGNTTWTALNTAIDNNSDDIADLQDEFAAIINKFTVENYSLTLSSGTNLAAGGHLEYSVTKTKAGYYPLGVVGFHSDKQATTVRSCYIDEVDSGTCKVHMHIRNDSSNTAQAPITGSVDVLWITLPA